MKLHEIGAAPKQAAIVFIGQLTDSGKTDRDGEPYFVGKLLEPITIRCSTEPEAGDIEVEELFIRKELVDGDLWQLVDEKDPEKGFTIPAYKADFSSTHEFGLFQETTIAAWVKSNRADKRADRKSSFLQSIKDRRDARNGGK